MEGIGDVIGILQHHDAITGTSKSYVIKDYQRMMNNYIGYINEMMSNISTDLMIKSQIDQKYLKNIYLQNSNSTKHHSDICGLQLG